MVKRLTNSIRIALRKMVNNECEYCHKKEEIVGTLQVHRITRGIKGGEYLPSNIKLICMRCHKLTHFKELF